MLLIRLIHILSKTFNRFFWFWTLALVRLLGLLIKLLLNLLEHYFYSIIFIILFLLTHLFSYQCSVFLSTITTIISGMRLILLLVRIYCFWTSLTNLFDFLFVHYVGLTNSFLCIRLGYNFSSISTLWSISHVMRLISLMLNWNW